MCNPEMLIRCATPVSRNSSQPGPSTAAWSPTASAASTPSASGASPCSSRRSRTHWRACSTGAGDVPSRRPAPRTVPVARRPCSNSHSSASKLSGLSGPCGSFRRSGSCQHCPARNAGGPTPTLRSSRSGRSQASHTRDGTPEGADCTSSTRCAPSSRHCGISAMRPVTITSTPSSEGSSASRRRPAACTEAHAKPAVASTAQSRRRQAARRIGTCTTTTTSTSPTPPHAASTPPASPAAHACGWFTCHATPAHQASAAAPRHAAPRGCGGAGQVIAPL